MENVACDFCGARSFREVVWQTDILHKTTNERFCIVQCKECGLHFLNPRPTKAEIGKYYSSAYSFHAEPSGLKLAVVSLLTRVVNSPLHHLVSFVPGLRQRLVAYIKPSIEDPVLRYYQEGGRILDIGCGSGITAHFWGNDGALLAYSKFAEVHGVEVADKARESLEAHGIAGYKHLSDVPEGLRFDIIRMNWSLEHVHSPAEYFQFIAARLTENGKAIIAVPNFDGLLYMLARNCVEVPIHLYHFRKRDILGYADKFGLQLTGFQTFSYPQMFAFAAEICPELGKCFSLPMNVSEAYQLQKILTRFDAIEIGNDMIAVLEKNNTMSNPTCDESHFLNAQVNHS